MTVTAAAGTPLADVQEKWPAILDAVKAGSRSVEAFMKECHPVEADETSVTLGFHYAFHKDSVDNPKNRALVEECFGKTLGRTVRVRCVLAAKAGAAPAGASAAPGPGKDAVVTAAEQMFGATVLAVEKTEPPAST